MVIKKLFPLLLLTLLYTVFPIEAHAIGTSTYYVDCINGNDTYTGTSQTVSGTNGPWKTIGKANTTSLNPGDTLLLKRGCTFTSRLEATWHGTEANPITISDYGTDPNKPLIQTVANGIANVRITGSY